jgi:peptidoglycan/LPS O-acetylase OafA/YrhL
VFWSLVVEMRFYVVFPVVVVVVAAFHRWRRGAAVLVGIVVLWVTASATGALGGTLATLGVDKHAPVFVLGVLTRALLTRTPTFSTGGKNVLEGAAWALAIAGVVLSMPALWSGMPAADYSATSAEYERFWNQRIPWIGFLMGAFFFCCAHGRGAMRGLLSSKPLVALGKLGFGIYLVHEPFIAASAKAPLHDVWKLGLALCLTVISSGILFRFFEEPIMEWGRRLSARLTPMRSG